MKKLIKIIIFTVMAITLNASFTPAQQIKIVSGASLTSQVRSNVVNRIAEHIRSKYVFPDVGEQMINKITKNLNDGAYNEISQPQQFAQRLTQDLVEAGHDKHVNVNFNPQLAKDMENSKTGKEQEEEFIKKSAEKWRLNNYNFKKLEILDGNIGYVNLTGFADPKFSKETVAAAMKFIENTNAVIIDLRENGGGDAEAVQLLCSYFFDSKPRHLNSLYWKETNETQDFYSLEKVDGNRMPDKPLYILTSGYTFSAAEEFSYNMQTQKRATLIGEVTGGGANPNDFVSAGEGFVLSVSIGKAINPITKINWEGTGVKPDIEVVKENALTTAQYTIMKDLIEKETDPKAITLLQWQLDGFNAKLQPFDLSGTDLSSYTGNYGNRTVTFENGELYYERQGVGSKKKLIPFARDIFAIDNIPYFRLKFERNSTGSIVAAVGIYDNGDSDRSERQN